MTAYVAQMRFHEHEGGMIVCTPCRDEMLANIDRAISGYAGQDITGEELVTRDQFKALGLRPWAGEYEPDRYIQCDGCLEQWGPDA